jgi:uncharacterized membrane protein
MAFHHTAVACALIALALTGCKKADAPPAPQTSESVAVPAGSVPASDANMAPAAAPPATGDSGSANAPAQTNPRTLSEEEESTSMPQPGQVNNHSTVDPNATNK